MRGVVSVVTGGGKTTLALMCILEFLQRFPSGKVFVIVPTKALLDQWVLDLKSDLNATDENISVFSGEEKSTGPALLNVIVINTARRSLLELSKHSRAFLIVDECHRAGSPKNALSLAGEYDATLGLSATPVREYDEGFNQLVVPKLGGIIYQYDYTDARRDGVISAFELINIEFDLVGPEREQYEKWSARVRHLLRRRDRGEDVEHLLKVALQRRAAISANSVVRVPLTVKIVADEAGRRSLVFHERVGSANAILSAVRSRGVRAVIYHSGISAHLRRDNLLLFREGVFDTLVCCRALDEGLNVPETSVAVISSSTASGRQRIQRLGRALRPAPGKACSTIYTLFSTAPERERLERESERLREAANIAWYRARVPIG